MTAAIKSLHVRVVITASLKDVESNGLSWPTITIFVVIIGVLSVAVVTTIVLHCYYRRRMKAVTGEAYTVGK